MLTLPDTFKLLVTIAYVLAGTVVYFAAPRRTANRLLSVALLLEPVMGGAQRLLSYISAGPADDHAHHWLFLFVAPLWTSIYLGFLGTLPSSLSRPMRTKAGMVAAAGYPLTAWTLYLLMPEAFVVFQDGAIAFGPLFEAIRIPIFFLMFYALAVALNAWWKAEPGTVTRSRLGIYALAFGARDLLVMTYLIVSFGLIPMAPGVTETWETVLVLLPAAGFLPLFAYGVLKYQLFDIDLKIKWTINRSTIAAAFLAVFFAASEGAAAFVESSTGSTAIGIAAAAALVFAISPLQRLADRVADTAMPGVQDTPAYRTRRREEVYQGAVEELLADGIISVKERKTLIRLQRELGLDGTHATAIEERVIGRLEAI